MVQYQVVWDGHGGPQTSRVSFLTKLRASAAKFLPTAFTALKSFALGFAVKGGLRIAGMATGYSAVFGAAAGAIMGGKAFYKGESLKDIFKTSSWDVSGKTLKKATFTALVTGLSVAGGVTFVDNIENIKLPENARAFLSQSTNTVKNSLATYKNAFSHTFESASQVVQLNTSITNPSSFSSSLMALPPLETSVETATSVTEEPSEVKEALEALNTAVVSDAEEMENALQTIDTQVEAENSSEMETTLEQIQEDIETSSKEEVIAEPKDTVIELENIEVIAEPELSLEELRELPPVERLAEVLKNIDTSTLSEQAQKNIEYARNGNFQMIKEVAHNAAREGFSPEGPDLELARNLAMIGADQGHEQSIEFVNDLTKLGVEVDAEYIAMYENLSDCSLNADSGALTCDDIHGSVAPSEEVVIEIEGSDQTLRVVNGGPSNVSTQNLLNEAFSPSAKPEENMRVFKVNTIAKHSSPPIEEIFHEIF